MRSLTLLPGAVLMAAALSAQTPAPELKVGDMAPDFSLPGSEQAVRLAMMRLILPEIGHVVRELNR